MRIISSPPFHDFYDALQAGSDRSIVFMREEKEIPLATKIPELSYWSSQSDSGPTEIRSECLKVNYYLTISGVAVLFCGKAYPAIEINGDREDGMVYLYNVEEMDAYFKRVLKKKHFDSYMKRKESWDHNWRGYMNAPFRKGLAAYFDSFKNVDCREYCIKNGIAIGLVHTTQKSPRKRAITVNPCLKEMKFYRVVNVQQTFQELEMWVGGVAIPQKPMPIIPDKMKILTHGFTETSFRREKQKRKN